MLKKHEFKDSVFKRIEERCDDWGFTVGIRIDSVIDLVKAEAKYHRVCTRAFFTSTVKNKHAGKPIDSVKHSAFNALCSFLDENEECQYSISELM